MSTFSEFDHHQFSDSIPFSSWSFFVSGIHFISDPGPRNDQRPAGNLFANKDTSVELAIHSVSLSLFHHMMSLNIGMKIIRPWNCAGFAHFVHELVDFLDELQYSESWENIPLEFHWLTINCVQSSVL